MGEKGKEVSGDTRAGLRAGNELGTTITLQCRHHNQRRGQRGNDRLGWGGVGGQNHALFCKSLSADNKLGSVVQIAQGQIKLRHGSECVLGRVGSQG